MANRKAREFLTAAGFLLPNITGFLLFTLAPILFSLGMSFFDWDLFSVPVFVDLANFGRMLSPASHISGYLGNTLFFLIIVPLQMCFGLATALLLNERLKGSLLFKAIFFVPVVLSVVPVAIVWEYLLDTEHGLLNGMLVAVGAGKVAWLYDPFWIKAGISMMAVWQGSAFGTIIYYAALQGIPDQLYEVSALDGAGWWPKFRRITLPLLAPAHLFLGVTGIIGALQLFAPIMVMTHGNAGGAHNLIFEVYVKAYQEFQMGYASALAWSLFFVMFILSAAYGVYAAERSRYA
ncbi:MAG: sugar ABC transporter permease [Bacteroidota bacterium]